MKKAFVLLFTLLISIKSFSCSCECTGDCSFSNISKSSEFVALVKVIKYSDFLDKQIYGYDGKMPLSMTVEVIEKYIGLEKRKRIKIWGDNGALCRPYIANFEIGKYYLIAPSKLTETTENGLKDDYEFFSCFTDYLSVDFGKKIAYGEYSKKENQVALKDFEKEIKSIDLKKTEWFTNNERKDFYKSDSIINLYKILNRKDDFVKLNNGLIKAEQNKNKDFTNLKFNRSGKLNLTDTNIENWTETEHLGNWKWKYDDNNYTLTFFLNNEPYSKFRIVSQEKDYLILNTDDKVHFYVMKLKRIKK
ncbi:hypothetical protein [Pontimicrobium aquaticum]|uniref:hypothetical protein n=1 Tax=Pontimicrobium aquaticum TaxID=2565367 RepID=UPI001B7F93EA|nr:hypothetical protein [Pontimicrobium aquaticum]